MSTVSTYLFFSGQCEEALNFYTKALSAKVEMIMRFNESPAPVPDGMLQAGFESKIMHSSFSIGQTRVLASDGCDDKSKFDGFRLVLNVDTEAEAHQAFNALAEGGSIQMPLCKTFWSPCYGMVTDKFNVGWMVMVPGEPPAP
ncbi:MAG: VOC family protein [Pirellulales bacterium]